MALSQFRYREDARWSCSLGVVLELFPGERAEARCLNLSRTGALLAVAVRPNLGERLAFHLRDSTLPLDATAEVVRHTPAGIAVRFVEVPPEVDRQLREALEARLEAARARRGATLVPVLS